jgi:ribosomal protein L34E
MRPAAQARHAPHDEPARGDVPRLPTGEAVTVGAYLRQRGYLKACARCGRAVVHAFRTGEPFHMHRNSKRCERDAAKRLGQEIAESIGLTRARRGAR